MQFAREPFRLRSGGRTAPRLSFSPKLSGSLSIIIELSRAFCCFCPNSQARKAQDAIHPDEVVEPLRDLIALTTKGLTDRILVQFEKDKIQSAICSACVPARPTISLLSQMNHIKLVEFVVSRIVLITKALVLFISCVLLFVSVDCTFGAILSF